MKPTLGNNYASGNTAESFSGQAVTNNTSSSATPRTVHPVDVAHCRIRRNRHLVDPFGGAGACTKV